MEEGMMAALVKIFKARIKIFFIIFIIVILFICILAGVDYEVTYKDGTYKEGDKSSTSYSASTYINDVTIENDGTIKNKTTVQELWDDMKKNKSRVDKYLSSPKELAVLMKAEMVTKYPDTRKDPDKKIDWDEIKKDADLMQGIVKFKRASDGQTAENATTMSYVDPATFQGYIEEYNNTGSETAKENALKHFTLKKSTTTSVRGNSAGIGEFEKYNLTEDELKALATVALQEQGSGNGVGNAAELSLMVNLYEREKNNGYTSVYDYVKRSGWFANASSYMDSFCTSNGNGSVASNPEVLEYARIIFVQGKRTLPGYVDEHDCTSDIAYVTNDGAGIDKNSPSQYVQFKSIIHQGSSVGSGQWTYYCHPSPQSDPFGYTSEERRAQIGELYYEFGTWKEINGKGNSNSSSSDKKDDEKNNSKENEKNTKMDEKTDVSQAIVDATNRVPSPGAGLCQKWVDDVYESAGLSVERLNSAYDSYKANGVSTDRDNIPIGAAVYGTGTGNSGPYGHVGIYIGDGKVVDNIGTINTQTLDEWISWQENKPQKSNNVLTDLNGESKHGWLGWGWADGNKDRTSTGSSSSTSNTGSRNSGNGYVAVVATWTQIDTTVESNDPEVASYSESRYNMTTTTVNYQSMIEKYEMPFDFLWALLVVGEEKEFVFELADLVYNSDIQVTIYDNLTVMTDINEKSYDKQVKVETEVNGKKQTTVQTKTYTVRKTIVTQTNTVKPILSKANTWIVEYTNDYTSAEPTTTTSESKSTSADEEYSNKPDTEIKDVPIKDLDKKELKDKGIDKKDVISSVNKIKKKDQKDKDNKDSEDDKDNKDNKDDKDDKDNKDSGDDKDNNDNKDDSNDSEDEIDGDTKITVKSYSRNLNISGYIISKTETKKYTEGSPKVREKTSKEVDKDGNPKELNFVTIFRKAEHLNARKSILSATEWLFDIVEANGKPDLDLVKYLLFKASGRFFDVTSYDFSQFDASKFSSTTTGLYGDSVQEQVWWALIDAGYSKIATAAVLGNIECESGFNPATIEAGNGIGLGLCQWSYGRRTQLEGYISSKGTNTSDVQTQIEFLLGELNPSGGANGYASYQLGGNSSSSYDGTSYTKDGWENATDLGRATTAFMALFERPSYDINTNHLPARKQAAQKYYDQFKDKEKPTADGRIGQIKLSGENAEKMKQMLTEALRIADDDRYYYSQDNRWEEYSYDCSSFTYRLYKQYFGIILGETTHGDYTSPAVAVITDMNASNLEPGDVLWRSEHVALYIGNGQYVHASNPTNGILVSTYQPGRFEKAFRYVK